MTDINALVPFEAGQTHLSSSRLNTILETTQDLAEAKGIRIDGRYYRVGDTISIQNSTGSDLEPRSCVGLSNNVFEIDTPDFENEIAVEAVVLDNALHYNRYAVVLDSIGADTDGDAVAVGACACKVNIRNEEHTEAQIVDGDTSMESVANGTATIIYKPDGLGILDCLIKVNDNSNNGVIVTNTSGSTHPASGLMKAVLKTGEQNWYEVTTPDEDSQTNILINDDQDMQAGQTKRLPDKQQYRFLIDSDPSGGDNAGAQAGTHTAKKGNTGLKCYGGSGGYAEGRFFSGVQFLNLSYSDSLLSTANDANPNKDSAICVITPYIIIPNGHTCYIHYGKISIGGSGSLNDVGVTIFLYEDEAGTQQYSQDLSLYCDFLTGSGTIDPSPLSVYSAPIHKIITNTSGSTITIKSAKINTSVVLGSSFSYTGQVVTTGSNYVVKVT